MSGFTADILQFLAIARVKVDPEQVYCELIQGSKPTLEPILFTINSIIKVWKNYLVFCNYFEKTIQRIGFIFYKM